MQFIDFQRPGPPDVLFVNQRPVPEPGPKEVLVQIEAAGVNRPDISQRMGRYPPPPKASPILGLEIGGTVSKIGAGVKKWRVGDSVCALTNGGGYAQYCTVPESQCLPLPGDLGFVEAASLPENYFTVWGNLFMRTRLKSGEFILIHGGSSGIGSSAIQLAKATGAYVITTVGNLAKEAFCRDLKADEIINYKENDFFSLLKERGVDVVLDMVGGDYFEKNLFLLKEEGRLVQIAYVQGASATLDLSRVIQKRITIVGSALRPQSVEAKARMGEELLQHVWPLFEKKILKPVVYAVFPFSQASEAHRLMESSEHCGKIVLSGW